MNEEITALVEKMIRNPGIYICGDKSVPMATIVLAVMEGKVYSMTLDSELRKDRFLDTFIIKEGPIT